MPPRLNSICAIAFMASFIAAPPAARGQATAPDGTRVYSAPLRVCAAPDDLPYSNRAEEGFENKLAEMVAKDLGTTVAYTWYPEHAGFVRQTLGAGECDVLMGVPHIDGIEPTRSYYRSGYVFVSRADRNITFSSISDPALRTLRIGVSLVGADGAGTPPAVALGKQGIFERVMGFPVYGDRSDSAHLADPIRAVEDGDIDVAAVWGPVAGYYGKQARRPLRVTPITDTDAFLPQIFQYPIAMAVRPGDDDLKDRLDSFISRHRDEIKALLVDYGVPLF
jgi:quinoprotein dehydrogenase-associated probable ABC transporter substrate-binding protein